jgi:hypothetical protein
VGVGVDTWSAYCQRNEAYVVYLPLVTGTEHERLYTAAAYDYVVLEFGDMYLLPGRLSEKRIISIFR